MSMYRPHTIGVTPRNWLVGLVCVAVLTSVAIAQTESVPAPPAAPPPHASGLVGKSVAGLSALGGMLSSHKSRCCKTPFGRLLNGAFKPLEFATGGLIPSPCPDPNEPSHKATPDHSGGTAAGAGGGPPGPQAAAEAIKQDQAQAKARRAAVRYLATVPCHYYPEAEAALIKALRTDRNECVRWEAAHALAQGCCCTKRTIEALNVAASGSQKDGNPAEISVRVRVEAMNALQHSLALCGSSALVPRRPETPAVPPETIKTPTPVPRRPEVPAPRPHSVPPQPDVQQAGYYAALDGRPTREVLAEAQRLIDAEDALRPAVASPTPRGKSLLELWRRSETSPATSPVRRTVDDED